MNSIASNKLIIAVLMAAVLGVLFGLLVPSLMIAFSIAGELFVNILQIIFIPLVGSAIITGVSSFANNRQTARASLATLFLFLGTTVAAVVVGLILVVIFKPGVGFNTGTAFIPEEIGYAPLSQSLDFLNELVPSNIVNSVMSGKFLGWMIVLTIAAAVLGSIGQKAKAVTDFFETVYTVVLKVLEKFMYIIPVGIFFVIGSVIARNSGYMGSLTGSLGKLSLVLLIGFLFHAIVVVPILLKFFGNRSPLNYFANVFPALKTALATSSPTAALPVTYENSIERNHIDSRVAALVLPVGSSLNVNGRALYVTVCALFIAQAFELNLGFAGTIYVALAAIFFSLGTAVVPFAAMLSLVAVFDSAGFPSNAYAGIGLVFVLDWFWGRMFAALDVWSDTAVAAVVQSNIGTESPRRTQSDYRPEQRHERGRPQRDYRGRRPRPDYRGREQSSDRGPRPYSRPERETVRVPRETPQREPSREKPYSRENQPSPFELKVEKGKEFDQELSKSVSTPSEKPAFIKKEESKPDRRDRRKIREQKKYSHGREVTDVEVAEKRKSSERAAEEIKPVPRPPFKAVAPPPLIRDLEKQTEKKVEKVEKVEIVEEKLETKELKSDNTEIEEVQTSLFGRVPSRKGTKSKSGEPSKPTDDAETYPKEKAEFGRGTRKKKV